ncbi:hypothetical protein [Luteirhabdus pelagi]|uniref:hypothetical protein n=1 Tax=Luteirhabdus pelagi TaxID=2792783 RepID=UPI001939F02A|nr:hypothetical protein [Luteirhabdus pelagi]
MKLLSYRILPVILLGLFTTISTLAQVGIGTTTPDTSAILDISSTDAGVLLPRLTTAERDAIASPATGLLLFNTDTNAIEYNDGISTVPVWAAVTSRISTDTKGDSVKYSNTDTTTDVNPDTAIDLPVFGTMEWNDNTSLYVVGGNQITINETGRYEIRVNVSLFNSSGTARNAPEIRINVNGTGVGSFGSTGYMRNNGGHRSASLHITETISVTTGDVITVAIVREGNGDIVNLRSVGSSNIYIEKKS